MKIPLRVFLRRLLLTFSILLGVFTFAGFVGASRHLEVFADFRPYYLYAAIGTVILSFGLMQLEPHRRASIVTVILAGLVTAVNTFEVGPWIKSASMLGGHAPARTQLRLLSFNLREDNLRQSETVAYLQREPADVMVLLESAGSWPAALKGLEAAFPHHLRVDELTMDLFSRHPVTQTQFQLFGRNRGFGIFTVQLPKGNVTLIAAHASPRSGSGAAGFAERTRMLEEGLPPAIAGLKVPVVLAGDLNASMWSPAYKELERRSGLVNARRGFGLLCSQHGDSFPVSWLWRPVDHVLHSQDCVPLQMRTGPDLGSDHVPIWVEFDLPTLGGNLPR